MQVLNTPSTTREGGADTHGPVTEGATISRRMFGKRALRGLAAATVAGGFASTMTTRAFAQEADSGYDYSDMGYEDPNAVGADLQTQDSGGQAIANFALQFQGYPYVYAGNTPGGFDCSGFTQYVIMNTLGTDIGHAVEGQTGYGYYVEWGAWQPGDLVYFANTYRAGISHTGVYIGDGQFIHAENEGTGVVISSVYSDYYSGHYATAIRLV